MEDFEEDYYLECRSCGHSPIRSRQCNQCDDGIQDDLYEEDPLWYAPGDWEHCSECKGQGTIAWCPKCGEDYQFEEKEESNAD